MKYYRVHPFTMEMEKMIEIQNRLRVKIKSLPYSCDPKLVCGVDLAYHENKAVAVLVVMEHQSKQIVEIVYHCDTVTVEYIPGLLAFRELPLILQAWEKLTLEPDVVFFDGNGMLHPRRMGIATHASFFLQKPTIGIAKTYLLGSYQELGNKQGEYELISDKGEVVGTVLRTQTGVKPVFVSVGNRITLDDAVRLSLEQVGKESRIPEIVRQADIWSRKLRKEFLS